MSIRQNLRLYRLCSVATAACLLCSTHAWADDRVLNLASVMAAAQQNFSVSFTRQAAEAAKADVLTADRAPFPVLTMKTSQMYLDGGVAGGGDVGPGPFAQKNIDKSGGIDWTWERGGKRSYRTQSATRSANAAQADLQEALIGQQTAAAAAYFDLLAAQERNQEMQQLSQSALLLAKTAGLRLKAGDLSAQEAARLEIEANRALAEGHAAELDQQRALLQLGQLTNLRIDLKQWRVQADWPSISARALPATTDEAWIAQRSDVVAAQERVAAAEASAQLANAQKSADVTLGTSLDHDPRVSRRMLELRLSLPLQWGYGHEGEIGRAQAQLTQAQDQLEKTKLDAQADTQRLLQELRTAKQRASLYEQEITPRAKRVAQQAELAYTKGASSLTDLLDARRTLRSTLIESALARADHAKAYTAWQLRTQTHPSANSQITYAQ